MYKPKNYTKTFIGGITPVEGEPIEHKVERILNNNEPIKDGAPEIYTERKDGVGAQYNVRTDRWTLAAEAMDKQQANIQAKRDAKAEARKEAKVIKMDKGKDSGAESTNGTESK